MHLYDIELPDLECEPVRLADQGRGQNDPDDSGRASSERAPDKTGLAPLRILLAEDDAISQLVAKGLLECLGHEVAVAENGREVLEMLSRDHFDLVVMDVRMPELDGAEATRIIRRQPPPGVDPQVPIVALTAFASIEDRERIMASGMDEFLTKPVHPAELSAAIERLRSRLPDQRASSGSRE